MVLSAMELPFSKLSCHSGCRSYQLGSDNEAVYINFWDLPQKPDQDGTIERPFELVRRELRTARSRTGQRQRLLTSHTHRTKPQRRPIPRPAARATTGRYQPCVPTSGVFAEQRRLAELFVRAINLAQTTSQIGLANLVYDTRQTPVASSAAQPPWRFRPPTDA